MQALSQLSQGWGSIAGGGAFAAQGFAAQGFGFQQQGFAAAGFGFAGAGGGFGFPQLGYPSGGFSTFGGFGAFGGQTIPSFPDFSSAFAGLGFNQFSIGQFTNYNAVPQFPAYPSVPTGYGLPTGYGSPGGYGTPVPGGYGNPTPTLPGGYNPPTTPGGYNTPNTPTTPTTPGGYGSSGGGSGSAPFLIAPSDPNDYASYLQAQIAGGSLQGGTSISQADAIPGTRFARVQNPQHWHADVARQYAFQFAAYASGNDPLSAQGLQAGAQAMRNMSPDAQLFMQVASVFKGNLMEGPGFYDNPGLKQLLINAGAGDLVNNQGVGQTDVQTIGAIAIAINRGQLSLNDVINSGTIDNLDRYNEVIGYVSGGGLLRDSLAYDNTPL